MIPNESAGLRIRILLADDHPIVREGLKAIIGRQPGLEIVAEAQNGAEVVELYGQLQADVVLMDLRMPEKDGIEATEAIRQKFPEARILLLTTFGADEDIYQGIRAGASGYVLKDASSKELIEAIHTVHGGGTVIPPREAEKLARRISRMELTAREIEVLACMADGQSNPTIAAALFVSESTIKSHISSILSKLGASDRTQAVMIAVRRGILHIDA